MRFELPPGPAGSAWGAATTEVRPSSLAAQAISWAGPLAWNDSEAWREWSSTVAAAREEPARRLQLVTAALGQGRDEDAWQHFASANASAAELRALLPLFVPGLAPAELAAAETNGELRVRDRALLTPRLPPLPGAASERPLGAGRLQRREMRVHGLHIGGAQVDLRVAIEQEGVQVDFDNVRGTPAHCSVVLPEPLDFELSSAYLDWERLDQARAPIEVALAPGAPTLSLYGRLSPRHVRWPSARPASLEERTHRHGFVLVCAPGASTCARVSGFAAALSELTGRPSTCEELRPGASAANPLATRIDFSPASDVERKFKALVSSAETWALAR